MKLLGLLVISFLGSSVFAEPVFPKGVYQGFGTITTQEGSQIRFFLKSDISPGENESNTALIKDRYLFPDGTVYVNKYEVQGKNGNIIIRRNGKFSGIGTCSQSNCRFGFSFNDTGVYGTESVTFSSLTIQRNGIRFVDEKRQVVKTFLVRVSKE